MNWKREATEMLKDYAAVKGSLLSLEEQIAQLERDYKSLKPARADMAPVKGGGNGREDAMINNIVLREELTKALEGARFKVRYVERGLSALNETEKRVLDGFYIHKLGRERICEELHIEMSTLYRIRDAALRRFTLATYGFTET